MTKIKPNVITITLSIHQRLSVGTISVSRGPHNLGRLRFRGLGVKGSLLHNHCHSFASNTEIMWQKKSRNQAHPGTDNQFSNSPHHFMNTFILDHGALQHLAHLRHFGFRITETAAYEITSRLNTEKTSHRKCVIKHRTPLSENVITIETRLEFQINV
jgi:hypothetical protein